MARCTIVLILLLATLATAQTEIPISLNAFNAGEFTPLMRGRSDFAKYSQGCQTLENMLPLTQGPTTRRPGTKYIATAKLSKVRLIPFEYSTSDAYMLEFGEYYLRVFRNSGQVLDANTSVYEEDTPFDADELDSIQYVQSANTMYLVDGNDAVQSLTRTGHAAWTMEDVNFTTGPFLDRDTSGTTLTASATSGSGITITASAPVFSDPGHVGSLWKLYHPRATSSVSGSLTSDSNSTTIALSGNYQVVTHGTWTAILTLQRSLDSGATWDAVHSIASTNDNNMNFSESEDEANATYRIHVSSYSAGAATYTISALTYLDWGVVKVTDVNDPCIVTVTVLDDLVSTAATAIWQEGSWSAYRGWPRTVEFHEERLWFGGSTSYPQTIWASQTAENEGDYENMTAGTDADSALIYTLPGKNPIQWLFSQTYLMVGTAGGVGRLGNPTEAMTPTNVDYRVQTKSAAEYMQPVAVGDVLLYLERGGRKIRQYLYSMDVDQYIAPDITILSEHATSGGITGMALQMNPQPILWCTRPDGESPTMTYLKEQEVIGWARQITDGDIESIGVIPGSTEDEVWMAVGRTVESNDVLYIEQLQPQNWGTDQNDCWFVDSGLSFDGGLARNISAATKANPCQITVSVWPTDGDGTNLATGDQVRIKGVVGMTQLNGNVYTVAGANSGAKTFTLKDSTGATAINSTSFTTYGSAGTVQKVENTFAGLTHLEGETVAVWGDGQTQDTATVASATITLDVWLNRCVAGLPYTSTIKTMPLVSQSIPGNSRKRIVSVDVDFYETTGAKVGPDATHLVGPKWEDTASDAAPELDSDWFQVDCQGGWVHDPSVIIEQTNPAPMTIRQLVAQVRRQQ